MKLSPFVLGLVFAIAALATPAEAQNYPWCAQYSTGMGGAMNCGFTSFRQCQADVSGVGGFCQRNNTYVGPQSRHRRQRPPA